MRALAAGLAVLAPLATITAAVFGIVWKIRHPGQPLPVSTRGRLWARRIIGTMVVIVVVVALAMVVVMLVSNTLALS